MTFTLTYGTLQSALQDYCSTYDNPNLNERLPQFIFNAEIRISTELKHLEGKRVVDSVFQPNNAVYLKPNRWRQTIAMAYAQAPVAYPVVSRTNNNGVRTLRTTLANQFTVGQNISVYNVGGLLYNGTFVATAATQFSVSYFSATGSEATTPDTAGYFSVPPQDYTPLYPRAVGYCRSYWPDLTQVANPAYYADYNYNNFLVVPTPVAALPWQLSYYETPEHLSPSNQQNWVTDIAPDLFLYASLKEVAAYMNKDDQIQRWEGMYQASGAAKGIEAKAREKDETVNRSSGT